MKKIILALLVLPIIVSAEVQYLSNLTSLAEAIGDLIRLLIPLVFALALLYFFWGLAKFVLSAGDDKQKGKDIMLWGIIALFVMASIWGIVGFIGDALGLNPVLPTDNDGGFIIEGVDDTGFDASDIV